jgi:hypothetical protein
LSGTGDNRDAPGYPGRGPAYTLDRYRTADDRAVEAMLASIREPCTASQLASGLEWTLPRTIDALEHLEAALAKTGQVLTRIGHHSYTLSPRPGLLHRREIARCLRHTRDPLHQPDQTAVTKMTGPEGRFGQECWPEEAIVVFPPPRCCTVPSPSLLEDDDGFLIAAIRLTKPLSRR